LREKLRLRLLERRIFVPKREKVTGDWRKLHNEELNHLYCSLNIVRVLKPRMRWVGHVARMEEKRCVYRFLVEKTEGHRPFGRKVIDGSITQDRS
jgi:hypothetical protein